VIQLIERYHLIYQNQRHQIARSYRSGLQSNMVSKQIYKNIQSQTIPFPTLLAQFVSNLKRPISDAFTKQYSPRFLFRNLVNESINKQQANIIIGDNRFGSFQDCWILNASCFAQILEETFIFIKFRNSIVTGTAYGNQRLVMLLEKKNVQIQNGKVEILQDDGEFKIILREVEMVNGCYDEIVQTFCDSNFEKEIGFRQIYDVYCYVVV